MDSEETINHKIYVIDTSVLIQAHRLYYAFDICPGFWSALVFHQSKSIVESIDRVRKEIDEGKHYDALRKWADSAIPNAFFCSTDEQDTLRDFGNVIRWVQNEGQFLPEAKAEFADGADGWIVAYAKAKKRIVVTQEVLAPDVRKNVPIPNVCKQFEVVCIDTFEMLRRLGVKFV
jgi:hypothetical protein